MARGLNNVFLMGALAKKAELRHTPSGVPVVEFTLAGEDNVMGRDGEAHFLPWYHRVSHFGKQAEVIAALEPGMALVVEGGLEYSTWDKDGEKRTSLTVKARRVEPALAGVRGEEPLLEDSKGGQRLIDAANLVVVIGNLTNDAEFTKAGEQPLVKFDVAINESYKDAKGEWQEVTHFAPVRLWRDQSAIEGEYRRGAPVMVFGRLVVSSWTDNNNQKRSSTQIEAARVEFLQRKPQA
jgi:single-strand DNA-binding protein